MADRSKPAVLASALATLALALGVTVVRAADPPTADAKAQKDAKGKDVATSTLGKREAPGTEKKANILKREGGDKKVAP